MNNDINQDAPVTDNQTTPVTPVADTKPADNTTKDATTNTPVAPAVPDSVKLDLSADQAEMVQDLLSNFVYAYRSDREVDCKRELVRRDQVGKYPYVAEAPDPSILNPTYDWVGKKWYSKTGATQNLALTKAVKELSEGQANQNKLLASMQKLMLTIAGSQNTAEPTAPTQPTTAPATDK